MFTSARGSSYQGRDDQGNTISATLYVIKPSFPDLQVGAIEELGEVCISRCFLRMPSSNIMMSRSGRLTPSRHLLPPSSYRPSATQTVNVQVLPVPADILLEIFDLYRMDEVTTSHLPWKWHRLAHVCRTWRYIIFASSCRLNLELLCTYGTPVRINIRYLPALPIVIHFPGYIRDSDEDNIIAALEHHNRVQVLKLNVPYSLSKTMATFTQKPFRALTHLQLESKKDSPIPPLPHTFLGGCSPSLQKIYLNGIPFPAAPTLLLSARDLVDVDLRDIPNNGYISPEAMITSLAMLSKLKYLTLGFRWGTFHLIRTRLLHFTRVALPALRYFHFDGPFEYLEDFVSRIDAPQLNRLEICYLDMGVDFHLPQLCEFIDRSEKLTQSQFRHADLIITPPTSTAPRTAIIKINGQFILSTWDERISRALSQISGILSNVDRLSISSEFTGYGGLGSGIRWLEFLRQFTAVKVLTVQVDLSRRVALALKNVTGASAAEVLPALKLLFLENRSLSSVAEFVAARWNAGRPVDFINKESEFQGRLESGVAE